MNDIEAAKRRAGDRAAREVEDGAIVGLGSGSTAAHAIRALGERVADGLDVAGVPTSFQSREVAKEAGVPLVAPEDVETLDVAIDGADQVAESALIKGGGGAHAREKLIAAAAGELLIIVDERKLSDALSAPVPLEVLPPARSIVAADIREAGGEPSLRRADKKSGPVITDNGNLLLDCSFGTIEEPAALAQDLDRLPGLVEHGLFVDISEVVYVGMETGVELR